MAEEPVVSVELLKSREMADRLRIDLKTLHGLRHSGAITAIFLSTKIIRWDPVAVLKEISGNTKIEHVKAVRSR